MNTALVSSLLVSVQSSGGAVGFTDAGIRTVLAFLNHLVSCDESGAAQSAEMRTALLAAVQSLAAVLYSSNDFTSDEKRKALAAVALAYDSTAVMLVNSGYEVI